MAVPGSRGADRWLRDRGAASLWGETQAHLSIDGLGRRGPSPSQSLEGREDRRGEGHGLDLHRRMVGEWGRGPIQSWFL